jgi:hypothetical protein
MHYSWLAAIKTPPHIAPHPPWEYGVPVAPNIAALHGMGCGSTTMCETLCWPTMGALHAP